MAFGREGESVGRPHIGAGRVGEFDIVSALSEDQVGSLLTVFRLVKWPSKTKDATVAGIGDPEISLRVGDDPGGVEQTGIVQDIGIVVRRINDAREAVRLTEDDVGQITGFHR